MPVSFTITFAFDSQRVKDTEALTVQFLDAAAQDADQLEPMHQMLTMPTYIDQVLDKQNPVVESLKRVLREKGNLEIVALAELVQSRFKQSLTEAITSGEYKR